MIKKLVYISFLLCIAITTAQDQTKKEVVTKVDRDLIKIGEEVKLGISVEADLGDLIIFPEQQTMGAMEVLQSYPVDSLRIADKIRLFKQYGITQFDSGDYWVPRLQILKNSRSIQSDSVLISVREVVVDTTKQGMFPIKDSVDIEDQSTLSYSWMWWLLLLIPVGLLVVLLSRKREQKTYEETLQPYEWTKYRLKLLDESGRLENREWKQYYTELTYIIRRYIDSKVYGQTLESTTGQLIKELKIAMSEKDMHITDKTQSRLEEILQKADLVKFATASGDAISAKEDRQRTMEIINNIHQVLPPPTEEELMQDARYRRKQEIKKRTRNLLIGIAVGVVALGIAAGIWGYLSGFDNVKDKVFGNSQRALTEQTWLTSEYGMPPVQLNSPDILVRQDTTVLSDQFSVIAATVDQFASGELSDDFYIGVITFTLKGQGPKEESQLSKEMAHDNMIQMLDGMGATDILMLDDDVEINGINGVSLEGTYNLDGEDYEYEILMMLNKVGIDQIIISNKKDDEEDSDREFGRILRERVRSSIVFPSFDDGKKKKE
ncbi:hypothetical protein F0365_06085 [Nonlabens sp. Ci31]|uniref:hypothetical protein n=1 Tax=Nonlabens sp. Ci31 TaxID=2608253 RepID=UPI00146442D7|nr:hypothetical protein [Nonlabens sp. Ci31]QJP34002.1 hypothetical protein F0365_06085 [Nonlabens sp. Ci31]